MPAGFDLIVDYGLSTRVCKLEVPALIPTDAKISNATEMKQRMYDFLADLVPPSVRGKEGMKLAQVHGLISLMTTEYENVTVSELVYSTDPFGKDNTITIRFKNAGCQAH